jgi:hypothetical protein
MSQITYQNAVDANGNTINIGGVTPENRATMRFFCIGCGREMVAVLGKQKRHHFRHKGDTGEDTCHEETYLHRLAKRVLKTKFDSEPQFMVKYYIPIECPISKNCDSHHGDCISSELNTIDLKDYYDTCEEEVTYSVFQADLMLSHSKFPNRDPVFLEVSVTHDSEDEKIASQIRIIEIKIRSESDVDEMKSGYLIESKWHPRKPHWIKKEREAHKSTPPVTFHNFKRSPKKEGACFKLIPNEHGGYHGKCQPNTMYCRASIPDNYENPPFTVDTREDLIPDRRYDRLYGLGIALAQKRGLNVKHCLLCTPKERCKIIYDYQQVEHLPDQEVAFHYPGYNLNYLSSSEIEELQGADCCPRYIFSEESREKIIESFKDIPYSIWTPEIETTEEPL